MRSPSPFLTPLAVDTWDADFRWREDGRLHDTTIDATWGRVARALTRGSIDREKELIDAFASWQLLLDERLMARAGTGRSDFGPEPLAAALNMAAFVRNPHSGHASFDDAAFESRAGLAVRVLDEATALDKSLPRANLRIGVIGFADAAALIRVTYGEADGCAFARRVSQALWRGCTAESARLLAERGAQSRCDDAWCERSRARGMPAEAIETCRRTGLRHRNVSAITSQKKLASLANCVSDALDPAGMKCGPTMRGNRATLGANVAGEYRLVEKRHVVSPPHPSVPLQLRLRAAMQPWIDERIDYPLTVSHLPDSDTAAAWRALAAQYDLGEFKLAACDSK